MNLHEVFSAQEIKAYELQGYSHEDIQNALNESVAEVNTAGLGNPNTATARPTNPSSSNSFFSGAYSENLIKFQLELDNILERIEHMLRGDKIESKDGSIIWTKQTDPKKIIFNDEGVGEIMRVLAMYLNINTILSNYDEKTINLKVFDIGMELKDLIYLKYKDFGLEDQKKRKLYPIIVRELVDVVHSAYLRALHGGERNSLREGRHVTESNNGGQAVPGITINSGGSQRGILNPMRYIVGKNK